MSQLGGVMAGINDGLGAVDRSHALEAQTAATEAQANRAQEQWDYRKKAYEEANKDVDWSRVEQGIKIPALAELHKSKAESLGWLKDGKIKAANLMKMMFLPKADPEYADEIAAVKADHYKGLIGEADKLLDAAKNADPEGWGGSDALKDIMAQKQLAEAGYRKAIAGKNKEWVSVAANSMLVNPETPEKIMGPTSDAESSPLVKKKLGGIVAPTGGGIGTPPMAGAMKARDGNWYIKKDGKTYMVQ